MTTDEPASTAGAAKPRLLDLFCGEGGASVGYMRAGFAVTGVDTRTSAGVRYPGTFIAADALDYLAEHGEEFDAIHASPPCQRYTQGNAGSSRADRHPDLIGPVREALQATGRPWVIENVPRSPLRDPLVLCGTMWGLRATDDDGTALDLRRHRWFESSHLIPAPGPCKHSGRRVGGVYGGARRDKHEARHVRHGGYVPARHVQERLMGIDWMSERALHQAIPPVYTQWIGRWLGVVDPHGLAA